MIGSVGIEDAVAECNVETGLSDVSVEVACSEPADVGAEAVDLVAVLDCPHGIFDAAKRPARCLEGPCPRIWS